MLVSVIFAKRGAFDFFENPISTRKVLKEVVLFPVVESTRWWVHIYRIKEKPAPSGLARKATERISEEENTAAKGKQVS